jgi:hypothetical protein
MSITLSIMPTPQRRRAGRPPAGLQGAASSRYPQLTLRVPPATKDTLTALCALRRLPAWRVVDLALEEYVKGLSPAERRAVEGLVGQMPRSKG